MGKSYHKNHRKATILLANKANTRYDPDRAYDDPKEEIAEKTAERLLPFAAISKTRRGRVRYSRHSKTRKSVSGRSKNALAPIFKSDSGETAARNRNDDPPVLWHE